MVRLVNNNTITNILNFKNLSGNDIFSRTPFFLVNVFMYYCSKKYKITGPENKPVYFLYILLGTSLEAIF